MNPELVKLLAELREKRGKLLGELKAILDKADEEKRELSEDEVKRFDALTAEDEAIKADIERREKLGALEDAANKTKTQRVDPGQPDDNNISAYPNFRYGKLRAFTGEKAEERAYRAGMWIRAQLFGDEQASRWCQDNGLELRVMTTAVNTAGGFLVPDEFSQAIIDLREEYGVFRRETRVVPMGSDTMNIPRRDGGLTAYFVGESDSITESDKTWGNVNLTAKKLAVLTRMSSDLAEDAIIDLADDLASEIAWAFANKEDDCGFNGDGTSTYGGINGVRPKIIDGNHAAGAVDATTNTNTFAEVNATDLATMMAALPQYALRNAKFYVSQPGFSLIFERLTAAAGGNTIATLAGSVQPRYLGYPVVISQSMPTSTGDLVNVAMLLFGDLALAAKLGSRRDVRIKMSEDRYIEFDQIAVQGTERFDINVHDLGDGTTGGPIVALIGA
ncbi:MAG: hypothetical protein BMS9Abin10_0848 [Gammaproteobacteria bacterium]|nr:MAG: hypothetical protein BMS9Abin10_0848 [Gammaproteobacteria bacterium]